MSTDLTTPQFTQPEVLKVTRLKPAVLQTWVNRKAIELAEQNPGYGRRRLYSALDVVKLAIMRRMADLRIDLSVAQEIAEAGAELLLKRNELEWDEYIFLRPDDATAKEARFEIIMASGMSKLAKYGWTRGDPAFMRVSNLVEPDRFIFQRRPRASLADVVQGKASGDPTEQPVDERLREHWARQGIHAEPSIVFPIGEIVNGALAQLSALRAEGGDAPEEN